MKALLPLLFVCFCLPPLIAQDWKPIPRVLPKPGIEIEPAEKERLQSVMATLARQNGATHPDVAIFLKAVRFSLLHGEFYKKEDVKTAEKILGEAARRLDAKDDLSKVRGLVVRGYYSSVDGSPQPYGLEIPENLDLEKPAPLWVWLHGRGDTVTDLHFIHQRMSKKGRFQPEDAIVLHPFGRQCIGFKSAGETDVLEAIENVSKIYKIDPNRIALMGFSMGGAGAWHIGAHYTDRFACVHAGAGFAETRRYINLKEADYPPIYEQLLWGVYDVPNYVRNLFNVPVIAYSGEKDKQIQAARVMEEAFAAEKMKLRHIVGPDMEHKYDERSLEMVSDFVSSALKKGREPFPKLVNLQTRTLRYGRMHWIQATALGEHWSDSRIDGQIVGANGIRMTTRNIRALSLRPPWTKVPENLVLLIDGKEIQVPKPIGKVSVIRDSDGWKIGTQPAGGKSPGLQGPIDDAFLDSFMLVEPIARSSNPAFQKWMEFELAHFKARWTSVFRGDPRIRKASEVTAEDMRNFHLVLWGDRDSNPLVGKTLDLLRGKVAWNAKGVRIGQRTFEGNAVVPVFIHPNPAHPKRYIVLNSGPTFRESHDRTNSLQNPKLPDWAVIHISTPPTDSAPGRILAADFFDERWGVRR